MAVTFNINPAERIIILTTTGSSDLAEWVGAMNKVLADPLFRSGFNFLSDRRRQADVPDRAFAQGAVDYLKEHHQKLGSFRWATLADSPAIYGMQRMFTIYSEMRDITARAFNDGAEALAWLKERNEEQPLTSRGESPTGPQSAHGPEYESNHAGPQ